MTAFILSNKKKVLGIGWSKSEQVYFSVPTTALARHLSLTESQAPFGAGAAAAEGFCGRSAISVDPKLQNEPLNFRRVIRHNRTFCGACCITFFQTDALSSDGLSSRNFKVNGNAPTTVGHFQWNQSGVLVFFRNSSLLLPFPHFTSSSSSFLRLLSLHVPSYFSLHRGAHLHQLRCISKTP